MGGLAGKTIVVRDVVMGGVGGVITARLIGEEVLGGRREGLWSGE
jgi:hypothetical protein